MLKTKVISAEDPPAPFARILLAWYGENRRDLPWRGIRDPYAVWLSEIILQQTRVAQGLPYYERFLEAFPKVSDLAAAPEQQVLKLWQGLGYYSRARNLHRAAQRVVADFGGRFPDTYAGLLELPGVGAYTAAAVASICYGLPHAVVDGNVYRVLSRYFDADLPIDTGPGKRYFDALAHRVMDTERIGAYNQAVMEFGARQCVPRNPACDACPLGESCAARMRGTVASRPVKQGKTRIRDRYFHYIIPIDPDFRTFLRQRTGKGIWQGLYEFPLLEQTGDPAPEDLLAALATVPGLPGRQPIGLERFNAVPRVHKLSHQHLHTTFWIARTGPIASGGIPIAEAGRLPLPVLLSEFLHTVKNSYF